MSEPKNDKPIASDEAKAFAESASEGSQSSLSEFLDFLRYNKKWWLTPIIIVLLLVSLLVLVGGTAAAPFIYTLF